MTTPNEATDRALTARARAGDGEALRELFERHRAALRRRAARLLSAGLRRKASIGDVLQEAYLVASQKIAEFEHREDDAFARWLGRIVDLKAREVIRRFAGTAKRGAVGEVSRGGRISTENFRGDAPSPSQVAMAEELKVRAAEALERLPADYREVLRLRNEAHLTVEETGRRMGRTRPSVKALYSRALARLARELNLEE